MSALALVLVVPTLRVEAATITAAYAVGYRDVSLNGYGASGLGVFTLRMDPGDPATGDRLALCIEAHTSHSTRPGGYRLVDNQIDSPQLDYLLWRYGWPGTAMSMSLGHDDDTATALGALAWFYAEASRRSGGRVWADPATGSAVSPLAPHPWSALPGGRLGLRAGGHRLTGAERRVHELFVEAEARRGPWSMSPVHHADGRASVTISGPTGPITEADGVRFVVRDSSDRTVVNQVAVTDLSGVATVAVPALVDGGSIEVSMFAPGVHQEWDGAGDIQRLATATTARLDRQLELTALPRHVEVHKRSTDDAFSPVGAEFELRDRDGRIVEVVTADATGHARFSPIDPTRHPEPYTMRESAAPAGLAPVDREVVVPAPVSTDPARPTIVEISNDPIAHRLVVRKRLDDDRVGPADRSGFGFEVTRSDDRSFGRVETGPDGRTPPLQVTPGRFTVCERSRPPWAHGLVDPSCVTIDIAGDVGGEHEVVYTNLVPTPRLSTRVWADGSGDGPAVMSPGGGELTDVVHHEGLVPGTVYTLLGEILAHTDSGPRSTGLTGRTTFVAESAAGHVDVRFEVPAVLVPTLGHDGAGHDAGRPPAVLEAGVVVQRLVVGDGSDGTPPVAEHVDPADLDQTFWIPRLRTEAGLISAQAADDQALDDRDGAAADAPAGMIGLVDVGHVSGLPPGRYRAEVVWHQRFGQGDCRPTEARAEAWFEPDAHHRASVLLGPVWAWPGAEGATLVAFQTIERSGTDGPRVVAVHADCDAAEQTVTLPAPAPSTLPAPAPSTLPAPAPSTLPAPAPSTLPAPAPSVTTPSPASAAPTSPPTTVEAAPTAEPDTPIVESSPPQSGPSESSLPEEAEPIGDGDVADGSDREPLDDLDEPARPEDTPEPISVRTPSAPSTPEPSAPRTLPQTGDGPLAPGGLGLMLLGAGGLVLVSAMHGRRRWS